MSSDESGGQDLSDYEVDSGDYGNSDEGAESFSGSDFEGDSEDGSVDGSDDDGFDSYDSGSEDEMPELVKVGKKGGKANVEEEKTKNLKKRKRETKQGRASDSEGEEYESDTDYGYIKPDINHIKSKEKNTYRLERKRGIGKVAEFKTEIVDH